MVKGISKTDARGMNFTLFFCFLGLGLIAQENIFWRGQKRGSDLRTILKPYKIFISNLPNKPFYLLFFYLLFLNKNV